MDIRKSQEYKALKKVLKREVLEAITGIKEEIVISGGYGEKVKPIKPRINEHIIHDIDELDPDGEMRKRHKVGPWDSEEDEEKSWRNFVVYVEKAGVPVFDKRQSRPYQKTSNINLCQNRRKHKKTIKNNGGYKVGEKCDRG